MNITALIGRVFLASIFVASGVIKLLAAGEVRDVMIAHYLDVSPAIGLALVIGSGLVELVGATLLILGFRTRLAVVFLVIALIPATFVYHFSMREEDQIVHFLKNASILGGLIMVGAFGPGDLSLDSKRSSTSVS